MQTVVEGFLSSANLLRTMQSPIVSSTPLRLSGAATRKICYYSRLAWPATAGFKQAMQNLGAVCFSFGGGCFYGHGVRTNGKIRGVQLFNQIDY
jgi:hypothetical protein